MSGKSAIFTPLASDARAEDVATRINAIITALPEKEDLFLARFTAIIDAKGLEFSHSAATATAYLQQTQQAATGTRGISQFLRRFLTSPAMRELMAQQSPDYEAVVAQQNGAAVAKTVATANIDFSNVPEKAVFVRKGRIP